MKEIGIYETKCRRCGKPIYATRQSITGLDGLKSRLGEICDSCITDEERREINEAIGRIMTKRFKEYVNEDVFVQRMP